MIPSAKTAIWVNAPPEKRFSRLRIPEEPAVDFESAFAALALMPGAVRCAPKR